MIKTGNTIVSIYTEMTPNPETMKFVANKLLYPGKSIDFADETGAKPSPLAQELFTFPFIKSVFIASNFITLTNQGDDLFQVGGDAGADRGDQVPHGDRKSVV